MHRVLEQKAPYQQYVIDVRLQVEQVCLQFFINHLRALRRRMEARFENSVDIVIDERICHLGASQEDKPLPAWGQIGFLGELMQTRRMARELMTV